MHRVKQRSSFTYQGRNNQGPVNWYTHTHTHTHTYTHTRAGFKVPSESDQALINSGTFKIKISLFPAVGLPRWFSGKESAAVQMWVHSLDWEDPLEKGMATHSSVLAWEIPWTEEPDGLQSVGSWRAGHSWSDEHECTCSIVQVGRFPVLLGTVGGKRKISRWNLILKICSNLPVLSS